MTEIFDNIRGIYDFTLPCEPLRPFIEFFSESSRDRTARLTIGTAFARETKQPFYSDKPALLGDGQLDPTCRPLYIDRIHHYLPNSQRLVFHDRSHVVFFNDQMDAAMRAFLNDPWQKVSPPPDAVLVED